MTYEDMMLKAMEASQNSYSPYSNFAVGACVLGQSGNIYTGCNFENSSYGLTICAERNAIGSAIAAGEKNIKAVAIYSPNQEECLPCGACRQVMHEFSQNDMEFDIIVKSGEGLKIYKLEQLLPGGFNL